MSVTKPFEELLLHEMIGHYSSNAPLSILDVEVRKTKLAKMALGSARRLASHLSKKELNPFYTWLSSLRENPNDPFFNELDNQTQITWRDEEAWIAFYELSGLLWSFLFKYNTMLTAVNPFDALLLSEMVCYYNQDEPVSILDVEMRQLYLDEMALASARRLAHGLLTTEIEAFIARLSSLRENPNDPFFEELDNSTQIHWREEEEGWPAFCALSGRIIDCLQSEMHIY